MTSRRSAIIPHSPADGRQDGRGQDPTSRTSTAADRVSRLVPARFVAVVLWVAGLIVIGAGIWLAAKAMSMVLVVVVPCGIALLLTALLWPLNSWLRRRRWPRPLAALGSIVALLLLLVGVGTLTGFSVTTHFTTLETQFTQSVNSLWQWLQGLSLPIGANSLNTLEDRAQKYLSTAGTGLVSDLASVTRVTVDLATGAVLTVFLVIFLLWDGKQVWSWFRSLFPDVARGRLAAAGDAAWTSISGFVHGTAIIASIHSVVIGTTLFLVGVPIYLPLAMLVFVGSFVPVVGAFVAGGIAVLITLGTQGLVAAVIVLAVLLAENELEAHVLQPFVVGRYLRLHPLAIVLVLTAGTFLGGIPGALLVVPAAGVARAAWGPLNGRTSVVPIQHESRLTRLRRWWRARRHGKNRQRGADAPDDD